MKELRPGDLVVHYVDGAVRAVSRVVDGGRESLRDGEPGWRVGVEVFNLSSAIDLSDVQTALMGAVDENGPLDRNGKVKQGYLWPFTDDGLEVLRGAHPDGWPPWAIPNHRRYWMFHAAPDIYDLRGAVAALDEIAWRVKQHRADIHVGDTVFLWEASSTGGIVARARVVTEPGPEPQDPAEEPFFKRPFERDDVPCVRLRIEERPKSLLSAEDLRAEPALADMLVFTSPQRTNSALTERQGLLLEQWLAGNRPPRIVKIAPGDNAKYWEECLAEGYVCVGWSEVGDLRQYTDWRSFRRKFGEVCELKKSASHVTVKATELWTLSKLRAGDRIVVNKGLSQVLAVGTVKGAGYLWRPERTRFKHTVDVDWDTSYARPIPPVKRWGMKTVDKVPADVVRLLFPTLGAGTHPSVPPAAAPPRNAFAALVQALRQKLWMPDSVVAHYLLALQTKRFVILTGVSGTGKTQLALAVAQQFQPRVLRRAQESTPDDATRVRVSKYMLKFRRIVVPADFAADLKLGGQGGNVTVPVDVEYPGGTATVTVHREVRTEANSVHYLYFKRELGGWFLKALQLGDVFFLEHLEPGAGGRDRIRLRLPGPPPRKAVEEAVVVKNYEVIPVRPDWTDGRGLLGFHNAISGRYTATPFLRLLLRAAEEERLANEEKRTPVPFFAILDEMNLARVEHYFAEFLSALESGEPIALHDGEDDSEAEGEEDAELTIPEEIRVPSNLFFTGTVNVDETTHMFSPKVLDRAFVIEFNDVDLESYGKAEPEEAEAEGSDLALAHWSSLSPPRPITMADWDRMAALAAGEVRGKLLELNKLLATENRQFGYRVANEMARFLCLAAEQCAAPEDAVEQALDLAVLSKVLPKLHGTQQELEGILERLFAFATGSGAGPKDWTLEDGVLQRTETNDEPWLPRSSLKLWRMLGRVRSQGFTSFIE